MLHAKYVSITFAVFLLLATTNGSGNSAILKNENSLAQWPGGLIIDHSCINLGTVPDEWIDAAQANVRIHYAHTSHGGQITVGLERIESADSKYDYALGYGVLPTDDGALCMLDGNPPHDYITPDLYWEDGGDSITQNTLDNNPTITVSLWSWCTQVNYYDSTQVQDYLDTMNALEIANPDVTFIYMTGNAQADSGDGYNRWLNNEMIRDYCETNNKILFDFADLDCWSGGDQNTFAYTADSTTYTIPVEHDDFSGDEAAHTTYTSCEQKGRAFWWLVACLAGWNAPSTTTDSTSGTTNTGSSGISTDSLLGGITPLFLALGIAGILIVATVVTYRRGN